MRVKQFSDFRPPSRRPWLLILLLIVLAAAAYYVVGRGKEADWEASTTTPGEPAQSGRDDETVAPLAARSGETLSSASRDVSRGNAPRAQVPPRPDPPVRLDAAASNQRLEEGRRRLDAKDMPAAREQLLALLEAGPPPDIRRETERLLGDVHIELVTRPWMFSEKIVYTVKRGDYLEKIARRFGVTVELIRVGNRVEDPNRIRVGDQLRFLDKPEFAILVSKSHNDLLLEMNGRFFKRYVVGTGEYGKTPEGTFVIREKIPEPPWWPRGGPELPYGHPDNILGTRWMSIEAVGDTPPLKGYGIHGTWDEASIGKQSSAGCIRMRNADVEELFMLVPVGTEVRIDG